VAIRHEAHELAINHRFHIQILDRARHMRAQTLRRIFRLEGDARAAFLQAVQNLGFVVADAANNTHSGDDDTTHGAILDFKYVV
jgi:hypothetical protein